MRLFILLALLLGLAACGTTPPALNPSVGPLASQTLSHAEAADLAAQVPSFEMTVGEFQSLAVWTTLQINGDTCHNLPILAGGYRVTACVPSKGSWFDKWEYSKNVLYCTYQPWIRQLHFPYYQCW